MSRTEALQTVPAELLPALTATERLQQSRARLRLALQRGSDQPGAPAMLPGWADKLVTMVRALPGGDAVIDTLRDWWAHHPLRAAVRVAGDAARGVAAPLARRQPMAMMLGALLAGAVLARLRPWRWLPRTLMFAGLLPQVASRLVAAVPVESWLNALLATAAAPPGKPLQH